MAVYKEGSDESTVPTDDREKTLPPLKIGQKIAQKAIKVEQHFTQPPPRYTEASLVKILEEYGIGRPSTYAAIMSTLVQREYVSNEKRRFEPTDIGRLVNNFITTHFTKYVDYEFTARLEDDLDAVSRGEKDWVSLLSEFWQPFKAILDDKEVSVSTDEAKGSRTLGIHPKTGEPVSVRMGRYGWVLVIGDLSILEKKPIFTPVPPGTKISTMTLEEALTFTTLPRKLVSPNTDENIFMESDLSELVIGIGRFGPYVRYGDKFASIKTHKEKDSDTDVRLDDPYSISYTRACEIVIEKMKADAAKLIKFFPEEGISILHGRWGPYLTDGSKNARIPKEQVAESLSVAECVALLEAAPERKGRANKKKVVTKKKVANK
jgi:DNA topoisomerase-1